MASQSRNAGWTGALSGAPHSRGPTPSTFGKSSAQKILETFEDLQRILTWHRAIQGLSLFIIGWSVVTLIGGTFDYWIRPADWPSRSIWMMLFLGMSLYLIQSLRKHSCSHSVSTVWLGQQLERTLPQLEGQLASGVEFSSRAFDRNAGSVALQQYAVELIASKLPRKPAELVVNTGHTIRLAVSAAVCLTVLTVFAVARPVLAQTALARIYTPWLSVDWPENVHLQILSAKEGIPASISHKFMDEIPFSHLTSEEQYKSAPTIEDVPAYLRRGSTIDFLVYNRRGNLPDDLRLETTTTEPWEQKSSLNSVESMPGGIALDIPRAKMLATILPKQVSPIEVRHGSFARSTEMALFQLPVAQRRLWFRVAGGDHATPWRLIEGIEPVSLERFQIRLEPPAYLQRPRVALPENVGSFEAPVGSRVFFEGTTSRPATLARLRFGDGRTLKLGLSPNERDIQGVFAVTQPGTGSWTIELADATGIQELDPSRFSFRVIADQAPTVTLETPETDMTVTMQAKIPLKARARDDYSLALTGFAYRWSGSSHWETIASWPVSTENQGLSSTSTERQHQFETILDLSKLAVPNSSEQETKISVMAFARDRFHLGTTPEDVTGQEIGHEGRSTIRWITILSKAEKQNELAERVLSQIEALRRVRERLEKGQQTADEWAQSLRNSRENQSSLPDEAKPLELGRQLAQISEQALHQVEANITPEFERIRQEGIENQVIDESQSSEWQSVRDSLLELTQGPLADLESLSSKAARAISKEEVSSNQTNTTPSDKATSLGSSIRKSQEEAIEKTSSLISRLSQWEGKRGLQREVDALLTQQTELQKETAQLATETIARGEMELNGDQKSQLSTLKDRQRAVAGRIQQWRKNLTQIQNGDRSTAQDSPLEERQSLKQAQQIFDQSALHELARDAADHLADNQIGKAAEDQAELLKGIEQLRQELQNSPPPANELLLEKIRELERDVQEELLKSLGEQGQISSDAEQLQKRNRDEELSARASKLGLRRAASTLEQAAGSSTSPVEGGTETSNESQETDELSPEELTLRRKREQQRRELMEQATREIAQERRLLQNQLLSEKISKVADQLQSLLERVQAGHQEIQRLAEIGGSSGRFSRSQLKTLVNVAESAESIRDELRAMAENVAAAEVLSWGILQTSGLAGDVAGLLRDRQVEPLARTRSEQLMKRLSAIVQVLNASQSSQPQSGAGGGPSPENGPTNQEGSGPPGEAISKLVQLRLIRDMQEDLLARTKEFEADTSLETADVQRELLAREQAELRELLSNLLDDLSSRAQSRPGEQPLQNQLPVDLPPTEPQELPAGTPAFQGDQP